MCTKAVFGRPRVTGASQTTTSDLLKGSLCHLLRSRSLGAVVPGCRLTRSRRVLEQLFIFTPLS